MLRMMQSLSKSILFIIAISLLSRSHCAEKKDKFVILQVDNRFDRSLDEVMKIKDWSNSDHYWDQTRVINKMYADKHNYQYEYVNSDGHGRILDTKVRLTTQYLKDHPEVDWLLHLDSDAFVSDHDMSLEAIKQSFVVTKDIHMIFEREPIFSSIDQCKYSNQTEVNTGAYLIKNSDIGLAIMDLWCESMPAEDNVDDQAVFAESVITNGTLWQHVGVDDEQEFVNFCGENYGGRHDAFIQHYTHADLKARMNEIKEYVTKLLF